MDPQRFDTLIKSLSSSGTRRGALRLLSGTALASLLTLGTAPTDAKKKGGGKGKKHGQKKVTICHKGQTKRVPKPAVKGHQKHGDTVGPCPNPTPPCTKLGLNAACTADALCCSGICNAGGSDINDTADECATCRTGAAVCEGGPNSCCAGRTCVDVAGTDRCSSLGGEPCGGSAGTCAGPRTCTADVTGGAACCSVLNEACDPNTGDACCTTTESGGDDQAQCSPPGQPSAGTCCVHPANALAPGGCPPEGRNAGCCTGFCRTGDGNCCVPPGQDPALANGFDCNFSAASCCSGACNDEKTACI